MRKTRRFAESQLIIASHNKGKIQEIDELFSRFPITIVSAADLGVEEPEETESTFRGNARLKALHSARVTGLPGLADDSGLSVMALGGAPGVYSARYAEREPGFRDFAWGMQRLNQDLGSAKDRNAQFVCALALAWPDEHVEVFEGFVRGILVWPPQGNRGFGYDPIFKPLGYEITFGEMNPTFKHAMSHRAKAFTQMMKACFD